MMLKPANSFGIMTMTQTRGCCEGVAEKTDNSSALRSLARVASALMGQEVTTIPTMCPRIIVLILGWVRRRVLLKKLMRREK